ncbi:MAG: alkaline phosphatase [Planctomycetaceae bacterium]|nr:alkaline phosphatase [Planctomycetaceae bacterium]
MKRLTILLLFVLVLVPQMSSAQDSPKKAKNVIIMIGDGMGFNQHILGSYWRYGRLGLNSYESFPFHCGTTTFCAKEKDVPVPYHHPGYDSKVFWSGPAARNDSSDITRESDSAAAATAQNTGQKTTYTALGVDVSGKPVESVAEVAIAAGKSVGAVTTVSITNATPAGIYAHAANRDNFAEIFDQSDKLTVLMGCAHPYYDKYGKPVEEDKYEFKHIGGEAVWEEIISPEGFRGFKFIDRARDFEQLARGKDLPKKVLGITRVQETMPPVDGKPTSAPVSKEDLDKVLGKYSTREIPTLSTMSLAALNVLAQNENGFYLMIEGGAIDHSSHSNDTLWVSFEVTGFTKAVDTVVQWVEKYSSWDETVLIVTADHDTGLVWGSGSYITKDKESRRFNPETDKFVDYKPIVNKGCGKVPGTHFFDNDHTNALVPLWGKGAGINELEARVYGVDKEAARRWNFSGKYIDNTDIAFFLKSKM